MIASSSNDPLARRGRSLAGLFAFLFWGGVLWLFAEAYVPLKQATVAWLGTDTGARQETGRALLRVLVQALPAATLLVALASARSLFTRVGTGAILVAANGRQLGQIGTALVVAAALMLLGGPDAAAGGPLMSLVVVLGSVGLAIRWIGEAWARAAAAQAELEAFV